MKATKLNNFAAKKHFGTMNNGRQVELMLTTENELLQIVNGSYSEVRVQNQAAAGKTPEQAYDMIRETIDDAVDFV